MDLKLLTLKLIQSVSPENSFLRVYVFLEAADSICFSSSQVVTLYLPVFCFEVMVAMSTQICHLFKKRYCVLCFSGFSCCENGNDHLELFTYQNRNHPFTSVTQKRIFSFDIHHKLYNVSNC